MSQAELARRLGVRQQTVSRWEASAGLPPPNRIAMLEDVFELGRGALLRLSGHLPDGEWSDTDLTVGQIVALLPRLPDGDLVDLIDEAWKLHRARLRHSPG